MTQTLIVAVIAAAIGVLVRWGWSVYTRNKEIKRLEAEKKADIQIHAEQDRKDAETVNPRPITDIADSL